MSDVGDMARMAQRRAADPAGSAWVAANAGSGKTRVLTERVARLLLEGAPPDKILCLTYTKAAAAEMQDRLFRMLGSWAMADDARLARALSELVGDQIEVQPDRARRLFAEALETPGGLKIQTIHAFCAGLLRRFPLEAGAPPGFREMDARQQDDLIAAVLDEMAAEEPRGSSGPFAAIAAILNEGAIEDLAREVVGSGALFPPVVDEQVIAGAFGVPAPPDPVSARKCEMDRLNPSALARMIAAWQVGSDEDQSRAQALTEAAARSPDDLAIDLVDGLLTRNGAPRKRQCTKNAKEAEPDWEALCAHLTDIALAVREAELAAIAAERAMRLARFGGAFITRYEVQKAAGSMLDFNDLVGKARALLTSSEMAQWALYRLDGGIDHLLVDEAQDTAPAQWDVIEAIVREFSAGAGARDTARTAFVVGDEKQSIYSFQGAAPGKFSEMRGAFRADFEAIGGLREEALQASFRSAPAILRAVDATFAGARGAGLTAGDVPPTHLAFHGARAGRVELWPLVEPDPASIDPEPWRPVDMPGKREPRLRLAELLANYVADLLANGHLPGNGRRVQPGDIIILLQARNPMMGPLIGHLKQRGVPVAGADRLSLMDELVVRDLLALMRVAVTEADDLSLAALLRSPLCTLSEEDLFDLAYGRGKQSLWSVLKAREDAWPDECALVRTAIRSADYIRPFEFLEKVLVTRDGRRRLLSRLGPEADDPIDELLAQALIYETVEAPSLSGFLHWIAAGETEIKREQESGRGEVRVMSAHGAKGLEAPIVILPDTMRKPGANDRAKIVQIETTSGPRAAWKLPKDQEPHLLAEARSNLNAAMAAEHRRLLYVAMTRAEDWLIVAGAGADEPKRRADTWYELVADGFADLGTGKETVPGLSSPALVLEEDGDGRQDGVAVPDVPLSQEADLPGWVFARPPKVPSSPRRITASALTEEAEFTGHGSMPPDLARRRGEAIHAALEGGAADIAAIRRAIDAFDLPPAIAEAAAEEAWAARSLPEARAFFSDNALAEVGMAAEHLGIKLSGRVDRLVIGENLIAFVDFKSDAVPPPVGQAMPSAYLAQMAAYRSILRGIYPDRDVQAHILWSAVPRLDLMDGGDMDQALTAAIAELVS
ncbi:MAG: double-strand break repair helicase AddA [Pseudomonadota bacterium]